jgi:hypothetical protein
MCDQIAIWAILVKFSKMKGVWGGKRNSQIIINSKHRELAQGGETLPTDGAIFESIAIDLQPLKVSPMLHIVSIVLIMTKLSVTM